MRKVCLIALVGLLALAVGHVIAEDDPCTITGPVSWESCIEPWLCTEVTVTSGPVDCALIESISERDCDSDGNGAKCAAMSHTSTSKQKYTISGSCGISDGGMEAQLGAGYEDETVTTTSVSLSEVTLDCDGPEYICECCNAIWWSATKKILHEEGWCEWLLPCNENPGGDGLECQGDATVIEMNSAGTTHADCSFQDDGLPSCEDPI